LIRLGIIGSVSNSVSHINAIRELSEIDLIGYYNPYATEESFPPSFKLHRFLSLEELYRNVDAVDLILTGIVQFSLAKAILKKSKHLYIENPTINYPDKVIELIKLAYEANVVLKVGRLARYKTSVATIKPDLNDSSYIEIQHHQIYDNRSDNWFFKSMVEDIDIVFDLVRSNVKSIKSTPYFFSDNSFQLINVRIEFTNKTMANLTWNSLSDKKSHSGRFIKSGSEIVIDFIKNEIKTLSYTENKKNQETKMLLKVNKWIVEPDDPLFAEFISFKNSIIGNAISIVNPEEGFKSLLMIHDILKKAKEKAYI
jgi:predicted dehydrogenase